jgi:hypothetical protein
MFFTNLYVASALIKIAVIDTGIGLQLPPLCGPVVDLTGTGIADTNGHGTNISGIIHSHAKDTSYCQYIIKYTNTGHDNEAIENTIKAFELAIKLKVDMINYSSSGGKYDPREHLIIRKALDNGIRIFVPSGNWGETLTRVSCEVYPACYDERLFVVGAKGNSYGSGELVDGWEVPEGTGFNVKLRGTSQATGTFSGKLIKYELRHTNRRKSF